MRPHCPLSRRLSSLTFLVFCAAPAFAAPRLQGVSVGDNEHSDSQSTPIAVGINIDPTNTQFGNPTHDDVADLGASWVRIEYKDSAPAGQPPTQSTLSFYQDAAQAIRGSGSDVQVLMILDYSSLIGRPQPTDPDDAWDAYTQAFADRCSAVVSAMGTLVSAYEIWNESDLPSVGNVPAQRFGPLLSAAYTAIHQAHDDTAKKVMMSGRKSRSMIRAGQDNVNANDADVTVVLGGLASGDPSYVTAVQTAAGGTLPADAIGLHPYGQRPTPDWPSPTWGFGVLTDLLSRYADVAQGKEIWITEIGTQDLDSQGEFPQRAFDAIVGTGVCKHVLWFCWSDGMVDKFGVLDTSGNKKASYESFQGWVHNNSETTTA